MKSEYTIIAYNNRYIFFKRKTNFYNTLKVQWNDNKSLGPSFFFKIVLFLENTRVFVAYQRKCDNTITNCSLFKFINNYSSTFS